MPKYTRSYRLRVRNKTDDADLLTIGWGPSDTNPYMSAPPSGDGESFDALTGEPTAGSYSVRIADPETSANTRPVTSVLADAYARQQMIGLKSIVEQSEDAGATWPSLVVGYNMGVRYPDAIEAQIDIGQSRRIEASRTVFKEATPEFPGVTSVIGGPVIGGFINDDFLQDHGGWQFQVDQNNSTYILLLLDTGGGFDPRKYAGTFSSTSTAIADFTNDWARKYFAATSEYGSNIHGNFPGLRARLEPVGGGDAITLVPLAIPNVSSGAWWDPASNNSLLTTSGTSPLALPKTGVNDAGATVAFSPSVGTEYKVWVYAVAISADNPLHYYGHPVDLWEKLRIDAGIPYDTTVLAGIKAALGPSLRVALRITESSKLGDFDQKVIYGPFRLSTRIEDGKRVLFRTSVVDNAAPTDTITIANLRSDDGGGSPSGTVFDLDESTAISTVTVKTQTIVKWSSEEADQPEIDSLISRDAYPQSIENSSDDIPAGTEREVVIGEIPGMIWVDGTGPISMTQFLRSLGSELFDRFGRGGIVCELACLPDVTAKLGAEVLLDIPHLPGAAVGLSPISQRGIGPTPYQIIQRTIEPEGPRLKLINSLAADVAGDTLLPEFTLEPSLTDDTQYGLVTITNSAALFAADLNVRVDYAVSTTTPTSGTLFTTILAPFLDNPTFAFDVGPVDDLSLLWVRMRAESPGFRPGAYTAWVSMPAVLTSIAITPDPFTVATAGTQAMTAAGFDQYGASIATGTLTWDTSNHAIATVNSSGVVTGVAPGSCTVTATAGAVVSNAAAATVT